MTQYGNPVSGLVVGQPISPNFGVQSAGSAPPASVVAVPPGMTLAEAMSRGIVPRNSLVTAVAGVSTGQANPTAIDDLISNGAGAQVNAGVAVANTAGNPVLNGAINQEVFVDGNWSAAAGLSTGPVPTNTETLTSCPVSTATTGANVTLNGQYQG